jgi:hypothetical protein
MTYKKYNQTEAVQRDDGEIIFPGSNGWDSYQQWLSAGNAIEPSEEMPEPSQFDKDQSRYTKRAAAKDGLLAYMAADNMSRVRSGVWTVPDLVALSSAPEMAALLGDVNTLSFELAVQRLSSISHPMLTPAIKADWAEKLTSHFYLVP